MARAAGLSRTHFSREFRRAFGVAPHAYLLTRRLEERPYGIDCGFPVRPATPCALRSRGRSGRRPPAECQPTADHGRYWARTSDLQLVELALSQLS